MLHGQDKCVKDTIGSSGFECSVGGDSADREHSHTDDEVGHQEHANALVESSMAHHKACWGKRAAGM